MSYSNTNRDRQGQWRRRGRPNRFNRGWSGMRRRMMPRPNWCQQILSNPQIMQLLQNNPQLMRMILGRCGGRQQGGSVGYRGQGWNGHNRHTRNSADYIKKHHTNQKKWGQRRG